MQYPSVDRIVSCNRRAILTFRSKRADRHEVLSYAKLVHLIGECERSEDDVYGKAAQLLRSITREHAFASGNRRTALLVVKEFLTDNGELFGVGDDPLNSRVLQGVREDFYTREEIVCWLRHGKIRQFKRP